VNLVETRNVSLFGEHQHLAQYDKHKHTVKFSKASFTIILLDEFMKNGKCYLFWWAPTFGTARWMQTYNLPSKFLASLRSLCGSTTKNFEATCDTAWYMQHARNSEKSAVLAMTWEISCIIKFTMWNHYQKNWCHVWHRTIYANLQPARKSGKSALLAWT